MIYPIVAYGSPVLKKKAQVIDAANVDLASIISNMWETMYNANGAGLAAPQIDLSMRLFLVDSERIISDSDTVWKDAPGIKEVFINPEIVGLSGTNIEYEEGCLSIPEIRYPVTRPDEVRITYYDADLKLHDRKFNGLTSRIIQHEYDHIEGVLFTDRLKSLRKRLILNQLREISRGKVHTRYRMKFPG